MDELPAAEFKFYLPVVTKGAVKVIMCSGHARPRCDNFVTSYFSLLLRVQQYSNSNSSMVLGEEMDSSSNNSSRQPLHRLSHELLTHSLTSY